MKNTKKVLLACLIAVLALSMVFVSCSKKEAKDLPKELSVWSFTDEIGGMITNYYTPDNPDVKIEFSMTPTEQFPAKLDPVLASGQGAPDVFALEDAFVRKYVESGLLLDLTDVYEEVKDKLVKYPVEVGTYNGKVYGMSWQVAPGAMFYRRSLAKKYFGTDDPAEIQKYFSDLDKFVETSIALNEKSDGSCVVVSAVGDLLRPYMYARKDPWIVDGELVIDPAMIDYMEMARLMRDEQLDGRQGQWSEGWFAGMKGELKDELGNPVEVFSQFLPTWGLHYVLKTNSPDTTGDWAMIPGPMEYRWGGTWVAAYKDTPNPELAKEFIKYIATDDDFLTKWAQDTGDVVSNLNVTEAVKDDFNEPYLAGQNHYADFVEMAKGVDGALVQGTDQTIEGYWNEAVTAYQLDEKTMDEALADFREAVESALGL